jgi:polyisoprenoid-binding protein YceI
MRTLILVPSLIAVPVLALAAIEPTAAPVAVVQSSALGAMAAQPAPAAQPAAASMTLDPVHSMALFRIQHLEAGQFWGRFNGVEGSVSWPLDDASAPMIKAIAKVEQVDTGSEKLDGNLKGPNFFNAKEFPEIAFTTTAGTRVGERHWTLTGDLSLHGVTKPVTVDCVVTGVGKGPTGRKVGFECQLTIKRSEFGMTWGIEKPPKALGDEVKLVIGLEADETKAE